MSTLTLLVPSAGLPFTYTNALPMISSWLYYHTASKTICLFQDPDVVDCSGNVLLDRFVGSKIILVPPLNYEGSVVDGVRTKGLKHKMLDYMEKLKYVELYSVSNKV